MTMKTKPNVLLIEDSIDNLEVLRVLLDQDYAVNACSSCSEALEVMLQVMPDLLLMDIAMPEVDGIVCLGRIRMAPEFRHIPAIAVTAYAYDSDRKRCFEAGFAAVVTKPILDQGQLRRIMADVLLKK